MKPAYLCILAASVLLCVLLVQARVGAPEPAEWPDVWAVWELEAIIVAPGFYVVQDGEQLFHVAAKHKLPGPVQLTVDVLREINGLWDNPILRPGQRLKVPETDLSQWPEAVRRRWTLDD